MLHVCYAYIASVGFEHCVCCGPLLTIRYIICIKRYTWLDTSMHSNGFRAFAWFYSVSKFYKIGTWSTLHCKKLIFVQIIKVDQSSTLVHEVFSILQSVVKSITVFEVRMNPLIISTLTRMVMFSLP